MSGYRLPPAKEKVRVAPGTPVRDSAGVEIRQGQKVAFNQSGRVVLGEVVDAKITGAERWRGSEHVHYSYIIRVKGPGGVISKVRNPEGIAVLPERS